MKKFFAGLITVVIIIACAVLIYMLVIKDSTNDDGISTVFSSESSVSENVTSEEVPEETAGGNDGEVQYTYYKVTVSEDRYITENGELTFDELISEISALGEDYAVEIIDDNATLRAYDELTDRLDKISVPYMEDGEIHE